MDRLTAMHVLTRVAGLGSATAAARELGMSTSAVSRHLAALEEHLGIRLLNRTTRRIGLTEAGASYVERAGEILADLEELEDQTADHRASPRGTLRVNGPVSFGHRHLLPAVPDFLAAYPEVAVDLTLTDAFVDLIDDAVDVAVRITRLADSSHIARRLRPMASLVCAAPAYLSRAGTPAAPQDLADHDCILDRNLRSFPVWRVRHGDGLTAVTVSGRLTVNSADAAYDAVLAGGGIAHLPDFLLRGDLAAGRLVRLFETAYADEAGIYAVYPHRRHLSAKVRVFVDFLVERFAGTDD